MFPFDFFSKAGIDGQLMLIVAIAIDFIPFVLLFFGLDDFGIMDIVGLVFIGAWIFMKTGQITARKGENPVEKIIKRFVGTTFVEILPYIGALFPGWTYLIYRTVMDKAEQEEAVQQEEEEEFAEQQEEAEEVEDMSDDS